MTQANRSAILWEETMARLRSMLAEDEVARWSEEITRRSRETGASLLRAADSVVRDVSRGMKV